MPGIELSRSQRVVLAITAVETVLMFGRSIAIRMQGDGWVIAGTNRPMVSPWLDGHGVTAMLWLGLFLAQVALGVRALKQTGTKAHRWLGWGIVAGLVPVVSVFALGMLWSNPRGVSTFTLANTFALLLGAALTLGLAMGYVRQGRIQQHVDTMFVSFVLLAGAGTYRVVLVSLYLPTGLAYTSLAAVLTWVVLLIKIGIPLALSGRLRSNRPSLALVSVALLCSLAAGTQRGLFMAIVPKDVESSEPSADGHVLLDHALKRIRSSRGASRKPGGAAPAGARTAPP